MGQDISVLSDRGDDHVESVVRYVNGKAEEIEKHAKDVTTLGIAIMVTLNIAEDLFRLTEEQDEICNRYEGVAEQLIQYIDKTRLDSNDPLRCT
jgi:cell division protein ZapA (FtsZ GTPase activity inhibitor)